MGDGPSVQLQLRYAGIVSRALAFVIDAALVSVVAAACGAATQAVANVFAHRGHANLDLGGIWVLAVPAMFGVYCVTLWLLADKTLGMAALGLKVVRRDGGRMGFVTAVVRVLGYAVSAILMLGFLWIAVDPRNQGFHDKLAGTVVVYDW